jgi:CrcB protein
MLAGAGAVGTLARFGLSSILTRLFGAVFPYGTLTANMLGCFAFGLLWALVREREIVTPETGMILMVGFLGAFTTFSAFANEGAMFIKNGQWGMVLGYVLLSNILGLGCVFGGSWLARWV